MKIKLLGFEWRVNRQFPISEFEKLLETNEGVETPVRGLSRLVYVGSPPVSRADGTAYPKEAQEYMLGLVATAKTHKTVPDLFRNNKDEVEVHLTKTPAGHRLMEFNLFAVHKSKNKGIYAYYKGSCSFTEFGLLFNKLYAPGVEAKKQAALQAIPKGRGKWTKTQKVKSDFKYPSLLTTQLPNPDKVMDLVQAVGRIKSAEFDFIEQSSSKTWFKLLQTNAKTERHTIVFSPNATIQSLLGPIGSAYQEVLNQQSNVKGRLIGEDAHGNRTVISLDEARNKAAFGEWGYDDIAQHLGIKLKDFNRSAIVHHLMTEVLANHFVLSK